MFGEVKLSKMTKMTGRSEAARCGAWLAEQGVGRGLLIPEAREEDTKAGAKERLYPAHQLILLSRHRTCCSVIACTPTSASTIHTTPPPLLLCLHQFSFGEHCRHSLMQPTATAQSIFSLAQLE